MRVSVVLMTGLSASLTGFLVHHSRRWPISKTECIVFRWLRTVLGASVLSFGGDVALDVPRLDPAEFAVAEEGGDVVAQVGGDGQAVGLLAPADLQAPRELLARLEHRHPLAGRERPGGVAHLAKARLGLGLGESVPLARGAGGADLASDLPPIRPIP